MLVAIAPAYAAAQFTTFIPPKKTPDSVKAATVAVQRAKADSITTAALTNMKTWVDSAAGVVVPTDSASAVDRLTADTTHVGAGMRAPATASELPLVALVGLAAFGIGGLLLGPSAGKRKRRA